MQMPDGYLKQRRMKLKTAQAPGHMAQLRSVGTRVALGRTCAWSEVRKCWSVGAPLEGKRRQKIWKRQAGRATRVRSRNSGVCNDVRAVGHRFGGRRMCAPHGSTRSPRRFMPWQRRRKLQDSPRGALRGPGRQLQRANQVAAGKAQPHARSRPWADRPIWAGQPGSDAQPEGAEGFSGSSPQVAQERRGGWKRGKDEQGSPCPLC
jgi:hypothetical protein